jgi:CubicO group peptidase (beta-lactamase class C family)
LDNGYWNEERIVDSSFLQSATTPGTHQYYGLSFWLGTVPSDQSEEKYPYVAFNGHLGQWIIVLPNSDRVIVRTGHSGGEKSEKLSPFMLTVKEYGNKQKIINDYQDNIKQNVIEDSDSYELKDNRQESDALPLNNDDLEN